jgi:hypothetical protein
MVSRSLVHCQWAGSLRRNFANRIYSSYLTSKRLQRQLSCAFAIERSGGVFFASTVLIPHPHHSQRSSPFFWRGRHRSNQSLRCQPFQATDTSQAVRNQSVARAAFETSLSQEFDMSALNGDKSRFNRVRKQKIARRKHTHELIGAKSLAAQPESKKGAATSRSRQEAE